MMWNRSCQDTAMRGARSSWLSLNESQWCVSNLWTQLDHKMSAKLLLCEWANGSWSRVEWPMERRPMQLRRKRWQTCAHTHTFHFPQNSNCFQQSSRNARIWTNVDVLTGQSMMHRRTTGWTKVTLKDWAACVWNPHTLSIDAHEILVSHCFWGLLHDHFHLCQISSHPRKAQLWVASCGCGLELPSSQNVPHHIRNRCNVVLHWIKDLCNAIPLHDIECLETQWSHQRGDWVFPSRCNSGWQWSSSIGSAQRRSKWQPRWWCTWCRRITWLVANWAAIISLSCHSCSMHSPPPLSSPNNWTNATPQLERNFACLWAFFDCPCASTTCTNLSMWFCTFGVPKWFQRRGATVTQKDSLLHKNCAKLDAMLHWPMTHDHETWSSWSNECGGGNRCQCKSSAICFESCVGLGSRFMGWSQLWDSGEKDGDGNTDAKPFAKSYWLLENRLFVWILLWFVAFWRQTWNFISWCIILLWFWNPPHDHHIKSPNTVEGRLFFCHSR